MKKWIILGVILALFVGGMLLYPYFFDKGETTGLLTGGRQSGRPLNVAACILQDEGLDDVIRTTGSLLPDEEVSLSFETSGKIVGIFFTEGTEVKKGTLLAKVNDQPLQAELKKLEAQIPLAQDRVFRQKSLLAKDAVSQEAYEQVTTDLEKLNADIELVKSYIAQTELRAPFDGIIGLRLVSEGSFASPTTIVAPLTKIRPLKLEFSINERQSNELRQGAKLDFAIEGSLQTYSASVYAIEPQIDMKTRTMKARAMYPNTDGKLKPGRSASIEIKLREIANTIVVPSEAVIAEMGRSVAYVYRSGKAQQVELLRGLRTESNVQILSGLHPGDTLIVTGVMQLRNDMPVTIDYYVD
ncbi:MAG: efflux RND transporter periplasmic adaptor subunit [Bacteroidales bacterium]|nr:efflux RND transporter periplasmic adaptor subunit [Bacteroidales bacterium]